jgi:hypothetical protein
MIVLNTFVLAFYAGIATSTEVYHKVPYYYVWALVRKQCFGGHGSGDSAMDTHDGGSTAAWTGACSK